MVIRRNEHIYLIGGYGQHANYYDDSIKHFQAKLNSKLNLSGIDYTSQLNIPLTILQNFGNSRNSFAKANYLASRSQEGKFERNNNQMINLLHKSLLDFLLSYDKSRDLSIICHSFGLYVLKLFLLRQTSLFGVIPPRDWSSKIINIYSFGGYDRRIIGNFTAFHSMLDKNNTRLSFIHYPSLGITKTNSVNASRFFKRYCSEFYSGKTLPLDYESLGDGVIPYSRKRHNKDVIYLKDVQHAHLFGENHYFSFMALNQWLSILESNVAPILANES